MAEKKWVDWDGLVYYDGKNKEYIRQQSLNLLKFGGEVTFEELHVEKYSPSFDNLNYIYKITDEFVADDWFESSIRGNIYPAGTWILVAEYDSTYLFTIFSEAVEATGDIDLTPIYEEIQSLKTSDSKIKADIQRINNKFSDYASTEAFEELEAEVETLTANQEKVSDNIIELNSEVDEITTTIEQINEKLDIIDDSIIDNKTAIELITETNNEQSEAIEELTDAIHQLSDKIDNIEHPTVDLTGYATEQWVKDQDFAKKSDIPSSELFVVDYNAPDFAAALEAYNSGKLLLLTNSAPDATGYAVMNYVRNDMITFTKFLMSRSGTYGLFNTYYLHSDNTWELAKEVRLNTVEATVDSNNDIATLTIGKNTYDFNNFATVENVNEVVTEVVGKEIETTVQTVIQEKVDNGEISVSADAITYGEF